MSRAYICPTASTYASKYTAAAVTSYLCSTPSPASTLHPAPGSGAVLSPTSTPTTYLFLPDAGISLLRSCSYMWVWFAINSARCTYIFIVV